MAKKTREELLKAQAKINKELAELEPEKTQPVAPENQIKKEPQPAPDDLDGRQSDFDLTKSNSMVSFQPNHQLMAKVERNERDPRKLQRFFWYKRVTDDRIICYTEREAALWRSRGSSVRNILRLIGWSDGRAYSHVIRNCGVRVGQVIRFEQAQKILQDAHDAELKSAEGNIDEPDPQNIHFDDSIRRHANGRNIMQSFNPSD